VPREDAAALAAAIATRLRAPSRTSPATQTTIEQRFRAAAVARRYWDLYDEVRGAGRRAPAAGA